VFRVPLERGAAYFKMCRPVQAFEPQLTVSLAARWPDRVAEVLAHDVDRAWLLIADAGAPLVELGNPPDRWLEILPRYAELQRGEASRVGDHLAAGVPDLRLATLPGRFRSLLQGDLPVDAATVEAGRRFAPQLEVLVGELAASRIPDSVEHADLHNRSVFALGDRLRILDWGDASIGHPFSSLVVTFDYLRETGLSEGDRWFGRLRDAYLEPWGSGLVPAFDSAQRVGRVSRALGWLRQHRAMGSGAFAGFDEEFPKGLRTAVRAVRTTLSA